MPVEGTVFLFQGLTYFRGWNMTPGPEQYITIEVIHTRITDISIHMILIAIQKNRFLNHFSWAETHWSRMVYRPVAYTVYRILIQGYRFAIRFFPNHNEDCTDRNPGNPGVYLPWMGSSLGSGSLPLDLYLGMASFGTVEDMIELK
jgi:hypothetical protein